METQVQTAKRIETLQSQKQVVLLISRLWTWIFLIILVIFFSFTGTGFLGLRSSQNILMAITPILLMGLGQTFVIIAAGIDLSVGWVMGLSSVVSALVIRDLVADGKLSIWGAHIPLTTGDTMPVTAAIIIGAVLGIAVASLAGLANGVVISRLFVPSFIVTLGMSFIARGAAFLLSGGNVVGEQPPQLRDFGNEALIYLLRSESGGIETLHFLTKPDVEQTALRRLDRVFQWPVVVTFIAVMIAIFILHRTQFGRHTYAIGGNREAALRAGVPVNRHIILLYVMSAFTSGMAGFLHTARFSGGSSIAGDPLLLSSIAAVVIGGASLFGGEGKVTGTVVGALIIAVLQTGLVSMNVEPFWQFVVVGVVVILAVVVDQARDIVIGRLEAARST